MPNKFFGAGSDRAGPMRGSIWKVSVGSGGALEVSLASHLSVILQGGAEHPSRSPLKALGGGRGGLGVEACYPFCGVGWSLELLSVACCSSVNNDSD